MKFYTNNVAMYPEVSKNYFFYKLSILPLKKYIIEDTQVFLPTGFSFLWKKPLNLKRIKVLKIKQTKIIPRLLNPLYLNVWFNFYLFFLNLVIVLVFEAFFPN